MPSLNELLEEQVTAEDGKELKSITVDGRKDFRRWTVRQWGAARDKGFRRKNWVRVDAGDTWSLRFGGYIRQNLYDTYEKLNKRYGRTAKPVENPTNARLASVWIVKWVIFLRTKRKERRLGKIWQLYKPKLRVNRLSVIRNRKVCESMRFDSGPEVFVRVNRNYLLTEYARLNENDCTHFRTFDLKLVRTKFSCTN